MKNGNRQDAYAVERLTALWGLTEAGLGGVVHALKIPFTGIVVGSTAVILITLIACYGKRKASVVLRATMIVLIIKAGVSPHTPVPAYFAVMFQGVVGACLFSVFSNIRIAAMLLGILALLEGVCHKFVVMTLIYGWSVWEAIDLMGQKLGEQMGMGQSVEHASYWLIGTYVVYYGVGGLVVGWLAGIIPSRIEKLLHSENVRRQVCDPDCTTIPEWKTAGAKRRWGVRRFVPSMLILALLVLVFLLAGEASDMKQRVLYVVVRAFAVLGIWFYVLGPLIRMFIKRFIKHEKNAYRAELERALELMPHLRVMAACAWKHSAEQGRMTRWYHFITLLVVYSILCEDVITASDEGEKTQ